MMTGRSFSLFLMLFIGTLSACSSENHFKSPQHLSFTRSTPEKHHEIEHPLSEGIGFISLNDQEVRPGSLRFLDTSGSPLEEFFPQIAGVYSFKVSGSHLLYLSTYELFRSLGTLYLTRLDESYSDSPLIISRTSTFEYQISDQRVVYIDSDNSVIISTLDGETIASLPYPNLDLRDLTLTENRILFTISEDRPSIDKLLYIFDLNGNPLLNYSPIRINRYSPVVSTHNRVFSQASENLALQIIDQNGSPIPGYRAIEGVDEFIVGADHIFIKLYNDQNMLTNMNGEPQYLNPAFRPLELDNLLIGPNQILRFDTSGLHLDIFNLQGVFNHRVNTLPDNLFESQSLTRNRVINSQFIAYTLDQNLHILDLEGNPLPHFQPIPRVSQVQALPKMKMIVSETETP